MERKWDFCRHELKLERLRRNTGFTPEEYLRSERNVYEMRRSVRELKSRHLLMRGVLHSYFALANGAG